MRASPMHTNDGDGSGIDEELQLLGGEAEQSSRSPNPETVGKPAMSPAVKSLLQETEEPASKSSKESPKATTPNAETPKCLGVPLKWLALCALTCHTSLQVFMIKFARKEGTGYLNSSCILFAEALKCVTSVILLVKELKSLPEAIKQIKEAYTKNMFESMKICVPAIAYIIQNTLLFLSLDKISGAVQQVTYQLKILAAALLGVFMLGKKLTGTQWSALVLLVIGVVMVQVPRGDDKIASSTTAAPSGGYSDALIGFVAVLCACFVSGFAGAYMEKILKQGESIWLRNFQLGFFGTLIGLVSAFAQDGEKLANEGLTQGFTWRTITVVFVLGSGGLLVATVLKYADNIARQFSTALSIILTSLASWLFFEEYEPDALFGFGTSIAIASTFLYSLGLPQICAKPKVLMDS